MGNANWNNIRVIAEYLGCTITSAFATYGCYQLISRYGVVMLILMMVSAVVCALALAGLRCSFSSLKAGSYRNDAVYNSPIGRRMP